MPTTSPRSRTALAHPVRVGVLATALLAAVLTTVLAAIAPNVFAFSYASGAGPAGAVQLDSSGILLAARETQVVLPSGDSVTVPRLDFPGVTVSPSPGYAGSQEVKVGYWVNKTENGVSTFSQVARKQVSFAWNTNNFFAYRGEVLGAYLDEPQLTGSRTYEVSLSITWYDTDGQQLAMLWLQPDQATQNRCEVTAFTCSSSAQGITLSPGDS